ncbi:hypothetical protein CMI37_22885 [Candidatus Pacearchaeota archaeon]|nr:hypothetical protein [Candidatus Pacearchaeota archaeon]
MKEIRCTKCKRLLFVWDKSSLWTKEIELPDIKHGSITLKCLKCKNMQKFHLFEDGEFTPPRYDKLFWDNI